jgi:hypothetical protein
VIARLERPPPVFPEFLATAQVRQWVEEGTPGSRLPLLVSQHLAVDDRRQVEGAVEAGEDVLRGRDRHADRDVLAQAGAVRLGIAKGPAQLVR